MYFRETLDITAIERFEYFAATNRLQTQSVNHSLGMIDEKHLFDPVVQFVIPQIPGNGQNV